MPRFRQTSEMLRLMSDKERIRNVGIVAHIDHGKTTLTDSLLAEAGLLSWQVAGSARALDYLEQEQKRGITIKTANISLLHETEGRRYVINVIDTPGHVDFTGKVTRALRAADGVIVVVDAVEEIMAQTETVTRQALEERVRPVLFINKVDRLITELRLNPDQIQKKLIRIVADFNMLIEAYGEPEFKEKWKVYPAKGTVTFGSALHKWGFTEETIKRKGTTLHNIVREIRKANHQALSKLLPLYEAVLDMTVLNCPSPVEAQKYRVPRIWRGNLTSNMGKAMVVCDDRGPTVMCITNVQIDPNSGPIATGRLFSGSIRKDDRVYLVRARAECTVKQVFMYMSSFREVVEAIPAGNLAALSGLDAARTGETVVDDEHRQDAVPFESMKYVSEPVITIALEPRNPQDLPRLRDALNRLVVEDPNLAVRVDEKTGEYLLSGMGQLHLETSLTFLKDYSGNAELIASNPTSDYRESVSAKGQVTLAKSPDKQNSFRAQVEPTNAAKHQTAKESTMNAWALDDQGNILIDHTEESSIPSWAKDSIVSGFQWACRTGPLCEQPMRNVQATLIEAKIQEKATQSDPKQIMRAVSRAILGSSLTAKPILLEPIYKIQLFTPTQWFGKCTNILTSRRGKVQATEDKGAMTLITGYIPVAETFDLSAEIRFSTSGRVFWQNTFDRWERVPEKIAKEIIRKIRTARGLPAEVPKPDKFVEEE
jgi:elongation factor 2